MNNFVISLSIAQERREHIHKIFSSNNIDYKFFDAIKLNDIEKVASELGIDLTDSSLKPSEISCLLSHLYLWKKVVDDDLEYITIYEDDIHLGQNSTTLLSTYEWIPEGCEIIKLEYFYENICIDNNTIKKISDSRNLFALTDKHLGCGGYIISKKAAIKLIEFVRNFNKVLPIDHYIFNYFLLNQDIPIYQMVPAICIQDHKLKNGSKNFYSYLSEDRKMRKGEKEYKVKLSLGKKIIREISRIKKDIFTKKDTNPTVKIFFK